MSTGTAYTIDPAAPDLEDQIAAYARTLAYGRGMNLVPIWLVGVAWYPNRVEVFRFAQTGSGPDSYHNFRDQARSAPHFRFIAASPGFSPDVIAEMQSLDH